ncbi:MAG: hypothetical protein AB1763_08725 [Campylobacterota bacterium]
MNVTQPNLGRPLTADSPRSNYIRFRLSDLEYSDFLRREDFVKQFCTDRGISYNRSDFLRSCMNFIDDIDFLDRAFNLDQNSGCETS